MERAEFIESIYWGHLEKYKQILIEHLVLAISNQHENFRPFKANSKQNVIFIYDPLELRYTLIGDENLSIDLGFDEEDSVDNRLITRFKLDKSDPDSKYDMRVVQMKREIEYYFLKNVLDAVEEILGEEVRLYVTQHITEVSFDISKMEYIEADILWDFLGG